VGWWIVTKRDNVVKTYLDDEEKRQLVEWADETGKSQAALLRQAVLEYLDHDRAARIEEEVRDLNTKVDDILACVDDGGSHTHTTSGPQSVPEKARSVARHIFDRHELPIPTTDVELAIENIADVGDDRSINKYKRQLKKRGLLYQHPSGNVWTDDTEQFVRWVEGAYHDPDVYDVTDEYDIDTDDYIEIVDEIEA